MSTNLILSTDEVIGNLLSQLSELAENKPVFQNADETQGEAVARLRPDVVLVDAHFGTAILNEVERTAEEAGSAVILFGGSFSANELKTTATQHHVAYLPLPIGPRVFGLLVQQAIESRADRRVTSSYPAITSAIAAVARARILAEQLDETRNQSVSLRTAVSIARDTFRESASELRQAVAAYSKALRQAGIPADRAADLVSEAVNESVQALGRSKELSTEVDRAAKWCLEEYQVA